MASEGWVLKMLKIHRTYMRLLRFIARFHPCRYQ